MSKLTRREREIAELLASGVRPSEIARRLVVSHSTVKSHISNICVKTGASGTLDLAVKVARVTPTAAGRE